MKKLTVTVIVFTTLLSSSDMAADKTVTSGLPCAVTGKSVKSTVCGAGAGATPEKGK
ncbi:hypothetical protein [Enterobacter sp. Lyrl_3]|uniref:hypothetical protein n=1 Tax=Enterobacter sp. Lyrl_3 TaxID=3110922 RepID=UPI003F8038C8